MSDYWWIIPSHWQLEPAPSRRQRNGFSIDKIQATATPNFSFHLLRFISTIERHHPSQFCKQTGRGICGNARRIKESGISTGKLLKFGRKYFLMCNMKPFEPLESLDT